MLHLLLFICQIVVHLAIFETTSPNIGKAYLVSMEMCSRKIEDSSLTDHYLANAVAQRSGDDAVYDILRVVPVLDRRPQ